MAKISPQNNSQGTYLFHCPACNFSHAIVTRPYKKRHMKFNGDINKPTFFPSVYVRHRKTGKKECCHFFITDGNIQYINDSTHHLKGQTVEIPDWDKNK